MSTMMNCRFERLSIRCVRAEVLPRRKSGASIARGCPPRALPPPTAPLLRAEARAHFQREGE